MTDPRWHLAQLNVGRLLAPLESEALSGFVAQLAPINALADKSPGSSGDCRQRPAMRRRSGRPMTTSS
jgi:Domain of unknown function (DUF3291)